MPQTFSLVLQQCMYQFLIGAQAEFAADLPVGAFPAVTMQGFAARNRAPIGPLRSRHQP
jgi:hypothetical protein